MLSTAALLRGISCEISSAAVCISAFILETFSLSRKTLTWWVIKGDKSREALSIRQICPSSQSLFSSIQGNHACLTLAVSDTLTKEFTQMFNLLCVNNPFPQWDIHQARGLTDSSVSLVLEIVCAARSCFSDFQILCWIHFGLVLKAVFWLPSVSPKIIFFLFSPKFWAYLLNCECPCIDEGESSVNGCTVHNKQEKADGCSVNGASPLDLTGRETFSLSEFLKAHWFFILAGFICFWMTAVLLSLGAEPFTGLHVSLVFLILAHLGFLHRTSFFPLCMKNTH